MAVRGYNFYLDGVKVNDQPQASGQWTFTGLASATDYDIRATAVDTAGNESALSDVLSPLAKTLTATPVDAPLSAGDAAGVDAIVADAMAANKQPGVIVSLTGPKGYYRKGYGSTGSRPVSHDDHFRMGSITKTFVMHAAWQAIDNGVLNLQDKLSQYVSGIVDSDKITVEHLVTMSSGIYDYTTNLSVQIIMFFAPTTVFTDDAILNYIRQGASLHFEPGTAFEYSNSNAVLIGHILKSVTGRHIRDIILEDIVTPLGLVETEWPLTAVLTEPRMADSQWSPSWAGAAGAMTTTATDLTKWAQEMRDGTLLSEESHALWIGSFYSQPVGPPLVPEVTTVGYGHFQMELGRLVGHGGSISGFDSACLFDPVSGATFIVANNTQTSTASAFYNIARRIGALLYPGSDVPPPYVTPWRTITLDGVDSPRAFGDMRVFHHIPSPGDQDGTLELPHKVPYQI